MKRYQLGLAACLVSSIVTTSGIGWAACPYSQQQLLQAAQQLPTLRQQANLYCKYSSYGSQYAQACQVYRNAITTYEAALRQCGYSVPGGSSGSTSSNGGSANNGNSGSASKQCAGLVDYPYYRVLLMGPKPGGPTWLVQKYYYSSASGWQFFCNSKAQSIAASYRSRGVYAQVEAAGSVKWSPNCPQYPQAMACINGEARLVPNNGSYSLPY